MTRSTRADGCRKKRGMWRVDLCLVDASVRTDGKVRTATRKDVLASLTRNRARVTGR